MSYKNTTKSSFLQHHLLNAENTVGKYKRSEPLSSYCTLTKKQQSLSHDNLFMNLKKKKSYSQHHHPEHLSMLSNFIVHLTCNKRRGNNIHCCYVKGKNFRITLIVLRCKYNDVQTERVYISLPWKRKMLLTPFLALLS